MGIGIVTTKKGKVAGIDQGSYTIFKGIPYAKPPIGELRWKAPEEAEAWKEILQADCFSDICVQMRQEEGSFYHKEFYSNPEYQSAMSEDCLYLNIWTPANGADEKLPVALWIHGGAFLHGFGHELEFDGEAFNRKGVILVTVNYRLGVFGFLAHPELSSEEERGISGNYGILDQIAAIDWVYDNIQAFGGDPHKITVFGQSAGSMSVQTLVSTKLTKGKISKAILQSGGGYKGGLSSDKPLCMAEEEGIGFLSLCGVSSMETLRALPAETLMEAVAVLLDTNSGKGIAGLPFTPIIDGYVLEDGYNALVEQGKCHDISYMIGSTKNDISVTAKMIEEGELSSLYYGCMNWSRKAQELGRKPGYVYYFKRQLLGDKAGAFHSSELWYVFGTLKRSWRPKDEIDYSLAEAMISYWTNFIKYGNPNAEDLETWIPCSIEDPFVMELDGIACDMSE